jgi:hypothetical protein
MLKQESEEKFKNIKKEFDEKFDFPIIDDRMDDSPDD